ncbi:FUSC family protein [Oceanicella sp. SM1341]|uniref:FUSC family protein n=1 Tax=Oceanicella sp. SM1341 TaxID=1548889 RepID=UPI000E4E0295|nr:FUSC family protein [Oceanicella sp. SM1341]
MTLASLGFDRPRLGFALRTALGACIALWIAWALGLEHPQWAGMTVWATSQPMRGQLLEKGLFRVAGTVLGTLAGIALVAGAAGSPLVLVLGLAAWIGFCAGLGNLLRSFTSYGVMLAGYTAAMVSLLDTAYPGHMLALGADRMLTVLTGVLVALAIGWLFAGRAAEDVLAGRMRRLTTRLLQHLARPGGAGAATARELLAEMAALEEALDPHAAGSLRSRQAARAMRRLLSAQVAAVLWLAGRDAEAVPAAVHAALDDAALALGVPGGSPVAAACIDRARAALPGGPRRGPGAAAGAGMASDALPDAADILADLAAALRERPLHATAPTTAAGRRPRLVLHRDWVGAREASIRATATMLALGLLWVVTGWHIGPFVLLGTAIMTSLFSTFDNPAGMMRFVFLGQLCGAAAALACHWLAWPLAGGPAGQIALVMPFVLLGALLSGHRRGQPLGFDYNMVLLLLLQPHWPLTGSFGDSLAISVAVPMAPMLAWFAYRHIFPPSPQRRRDTLVAMMVRELEDMASRRGGSDRRPVWQARLNHRVLRLASASEKSPRAGVSATRGSLAVLLLGRAILHLQDLAAAPGLGPGTARRLEAALHRLAALRRNPERAARALAATARHLSALSRGDPALLGGAARALADNRDFFRDARL